MCRDGASFERLRDMRALYEGYADSLSEHLCMPLPPWINEHPHKDNWLVVAKLRAKTEAADNPSTETANAVSTAQTIARVIDEHHEF